MRIDWFKAQLENKLNFETDLDVAEEGTLSAAVSLIFCLQNNSVELLFIQRAQHPKDPWSGHIAFPGGGYEVSDKDFLETAIRETREELGVQLNTSDCVGSLSGCYGPLVGSRKTVVIKPFVFLVTEKPKLSPNYEVEQGFWVSLEALFNQENIKQFKHPTEEAHEMYGIDLNLESGTLLWGLSLDILYSLFNQIELPTEQELITFKKII